MANKIKTGTDIMSTRLLAIEARPPIKSWLRLRLAMISKSWGCMPTRDEKAASKCPLVSKTLILYKITGLNKIKIIPQSLIAVFIL